MRLKSESESFSCVRSVCNQIVGVCTHLLSLLCARMQQLGRPWWSMGCEMTGFTRGIQKLNTKFRIQITISLHWFYFQGLHGPWVFNLHAIQNTNFRLTLSHFASTQPTLVYIWKDHKFRNQAKMVWKIQKWILKRCKVYYMSSIGCISKLVIFGDCWRRAFAKPYKLALNVKFWNFQQWGIFCCK